MASERSPDVDRYAAYWRRRELSVWQRLREALTTLRERITGSTPPPPDPPPPFDPALVPAGPPRRPRPSSAVALEPPEDDLPEDLTAYPKESD